MNRKLIKNLSTIKSGMLTLCIGESTGKNIALSLKCAERIAKEKALGNVLYLNTVQTSRQLADSIRKHANAKYSELTDDPRIVYESSQVGLVLDEKDELEKILAEGRASYVIINCWEFASKDYRRKSDLIFLLNGWMEKYGATILVFAERMKNAPESQKIQRGAGVGKLAAIAAEVKVLRAPKRDEREEEPEEESESLSEKMFREYLELPMDLWKPRTQKEEYAAKNIMEKRKGYFNYLSGEPREAHRKRLWKMITDDMREYPAAYKSVLGDPPFRITPVTMDELSARLPDSEDPKRTTVQQQPDKPAVPNEKRKAKGENGDLEIIRSDNGDKPVGVRVLLKG